MANCDGGVKTYVPFSYNTRVWWPVLAGAVGPGSLTDHIYSLVDEMRPNDFLDAVHRLDRERPHGEPPWLNDAWKLSSPTLPVVKRALRWMADLTGWRDPVRGGIDGLDTWLEIPATSSAQVYHGGKTPAAKAMAAHAGSWVKTADDPARRSAHPERRRGGAKRELHGWRTVRVPVQLGWRLVGAYAAGPTSQHPLPESHR